MKQLSITHEPGTALSIPWRKREIAEQSAKVFRRRGIACEIVRQGSRFVVVSA